MSGTTIWRTVDAKELDVVVARLAVSQPCDLGARRLTLRAGSG